MKKLICAVTVFLLAAAAMPAFGQAKKNDRLWGLIFNLDANLDVNAYNDSSGQAGMGIKYWLANNLALRALVALDISSTTNTANPPVTTTAVKSCLGLAAEFHPIKNDVSPYFGGLLGVIALPQPAGNAVSINFYFGGILGAEAKLWNYISIYAEYCLMGLVQQGSFDLTLQMGNGGQVGLLFYIQ